MVKSCIWYKMQKVPKDIQWGLLLLFSSPQPLSPGTHKCQTLCRSKTMGVHILKTNKPTRNLHMVVLLSTWLFPYLSLGENFPSLTQSCLILFPSCLWSYRHRTKAPPQDVWLVSELLVFVLMIETVNQMKRDENSS